MVYWDNFHEIILWLWYKTRARFVSLVFCIFPKISFPVLHIKRDNKYPGEFYVDP